MVKISIFIFITFTMFSCAMPGSEKCKYDTIPIKAVVKEIKKDYIVVKYYYGDISYSVENVKFVDTHVGEIFPASMHNITQGACKPRYFSVDK